MSKVIVVIFRINEDAFPEMCDMDENKLRYHFEKGYFMLGDTYGTLEKEDVLTPAQVSVVDG